MTRGVLTLALGPPFYYQLAVNLARSFVLWHPETSLRFVLATDSELPLPDDLTGIEILRLPVGRYGSGFSPKLHLDEITPLDRTLFIDADCLCVRSVEPAFALFTGRAVSVSGKMISEGEWFGDVARVRKKFGLPAIPKFNGGIYYLEKGELAEDIYATARLLEPHYDELGLVRMRGSATDELLMSLAQAIHGATPVPDDGTLMSDPQACPGPLSIDVLTGKAVLTNPPVPDPRHIPWYPHSRVEPAIVHFLGHHSHGLIYRREALLLARRHWPRFLARFVTALTFSWPGEIVLGLKNLLRPLYHRLFGVRPVSSESR